MSVTYIIIGVGIVWIVFLWFSLSNESKQERLRIERAKQIEQERLRAEQERLLAYKNELIYPIDIYIQNNSFVVINNKYIVVDTNMLLSKDNLKVLNILKDNNQNKIVVLSVVMDELRNLKEKQKQTNIPINKAFSFIKDAGNKIKYEDIHNKFYYDKRLNSYAKEYFVAFLEKKPNYLFITNDTDLFIRLRGKFGDRILDPNQIIKYRLAHELLNFKSRIQNENNYNNLSDLEQGVSSLLFKLKQL